MLQRGRAGARPARHRPTESRRGQGGPPPATATAPKRPREKPIDGRPPNHGRIGRPAGKREHIKTTTDPDAAGQRSATARRANSEESGRPQRCAVASMAAPAATRPASPPSPNALERGRGGGGRKARGRGGRDDYSSPRTATANGRGKSPLRGAPIPRAPDNGRWPPSPRTHDRQPRPHRGRGAGGRGGEHTNPRQARDPQQGRVARATCAPPQRWERQGKTLHFFSARRGHGGSMPPRTRTPPATKAGQMPTLLRVPRHPARWR